VLAALTTEKPCVDVENRVHFHDGTVHWHSWTHHAIFDQDGTVIEYQAVGRDITGQKRAEEVLRRERKLFVDIMNATDVMLVYLDTEFNFLAVNNAYAETCRMLPTEMIGRNHFELYPHAENETIFRQVRDSGIPVFYRDKPFEFPDQPERGVTYWDWSLVPTKSEAGSITGLVLSLRETTAYKQVELARNSYSEQLKVALEAANAGAWTWNMKTGELNWSRELFVLLGLDPETSEASFDTWQQLMHPDDLEIARHAIEQSLLSRTKLLDETRVVLPDGTFRWIRTQGYPEYDETGTPVRMSGISIDISERKQYEESLKQSEEMARAILSATKDLILFISPDGTILLANEAVAERFGQTVDNFVGTNIFPYFPEDLRRLRQGKLEEAIKSHVPVRYEDGRAGRFFDNCLFPVINSDKKVSGIAVFSRDISEQKEYETALERAKDELETRVNERTASLSKANEQISQMTFQLLKTEEQERMRIAAELHDQVGQSLLLAKIKVDALDSDTSTDKNDNTRADISKLLEDCIQDIRTLTFDMRPPLLDTAGIEAAVEWLCKSIYVNYRLQVDFSTSCQSIRLSSEHRYSLYQAVRELLLNVAKHSGVDHAELSLKPAGSDLIIQVSDKGSGFETASHSCSSASGLGFGLFNVSQRLHLLGGYCHLDTHPGKGTIVTLKIPMGE